MVRETNPQGRARYALALLGLAVAACVYDDGDRCDANQRLVNGRHCVCLDGFAMVDGECVDCGANAVADGSTCRCREGYEMAADGECVPATLAAGQPCDAEHPCEDPVYAHCHVDGSTDGYCTNLECLDSNDCARGYVCVVDANPTYCARLPEGVGVACSSPDDCASFVADYCENLFAGVCLEAGCERDDECLGDWICCPAAPVLGQNLCVPEEECVLP